MHKIALMQFYILMLKVKEKLHVLEIKDNKAQEYELLDEQALKIRINNYQNQVIDANTIDYDQIATNLIFL